MSRKIKLFGVGFSSDDSDASVEIKVDGNVVYSGNVVTDKNVDINAFLSGSDTVDQEEVASWEEGEDAVIRTLSITAVSGNFLYTETLGSFLGEEDSDDDELVFVHTYTDEDGDQVADPNYNVKLDDEPYEDGGPKNRTELFGQWDIGIPEGSTVVCDLKIDAGTTRPETSEDDEENLD